MITSTANKRVKELIEKMNKAKARREADVFLVEGPKMFLEAPKKQIRMVYVEENYLLKAPKEVTEKLEELPYEVLSSEVYGKVSDTKTPQGILCELQQFHYSLEELLGAGMDENALFMVLEDLQDPGNVGTILRTAEGAGVSAVLMTKGTADIYNPKTIRSTMGSIYRVPFVSVEDVAEAIRMLKERGVKVYAAHLKGKNYYQNMNLSGKVAFLIGNEGNGLKDSTAELADEYLKIPMCGKVESLNAAMAAGLLMYQKAFGIKGN